MIPVVVRHAIASGFEPPPKVSRSTPIIGPSSQMGGGGQSIRAQTKCAIGPSNEITTMVIMQKIRSSDERRPMDLAKIAAMIAPHEKRKRSINPMRCGGKLVANLKGQITICSSATMVIKSIKTCRIGAGAGRSLNRSIGHATQSPIAMAAKKSRMPGR